MATGTAAPQAQQHQTVPVVKLPEVLELVGKKIGMTQFYTPDGKCVPVTAVELGPNAILQIKKQETDGYVALQVAFDPLKNEKAVKRFYDYVAARNELLKLRENLKQTKEDAKKIELKKHIAAKRKNLAAIRTWTLPELGHFAKVNVAPHYCVEEIRWNGKGEYKTGDRLTCELFEGLQFVDVVGTTKGRGFTGVVKRWRFHGGPMTHGQSDRPRAPGAIGRQGSISRNVIPNKKMSGHYGHDRVTQKNLEIVKIYKEQNLILLKGAAPGPNGGYLIIRANAKVRKEQPVSAKKKLILIRKK